MAGGPCPTAGSTDPSAHRAPLPEILPLRRTVLASLLAALAFAPLSGCGHQVTPDRVYDDQPGQMVINYTVNGTLDFTGLNYVIVLNTCGVGGEPYPNGYSTTYTNYTYVFGVGASLFQTTVAPALFEYYLSSGSLYKLPVTLGSSTTSFIPDLYGDGTTFQLTFTRAQLNNPLKEATPCPAGGMPLAPIWYINFFSLDGNGNVLDSLGQGGPTDTTFSLPINTTALVQHTISRPTGWTHASNPNAWITGGEIISYP